MNNRERDEYKVEVFSPVGQRVVNAIGISGVKEVYERSDNTKFRADKVLDGSVTFLCDDYEYFKTLSESERRYDTVRAVIYTTCQSVMAVKWRAFIDIRKGTFDHVKKSFVVPFNLETTVGDFDSLKSNEFNLFKLVTYRVTTTPQYTTTTESTVVYTNGIPVYSALLGMFRETLAVAYVKSDFFGWNPDDPTYVYGNSDLLHNIALFHKSDIVKASSNGYLVATIMKMTLEQLINNLCSTLNLQWTLDAAGNFRIEHISWYARASGVDLTVDRWRDYLTKEYTYAEEKIYRLEKFTNEQSLNIDFIGQPIEYKNNFIKSLRTAVGNFTTERPDADALTRTSSFITDVDGIYGNVGSVTATVPNREADLSGIVLLALDSSGNIQKVPGILETTPTDRNNNVLSWAVVQNDYWKYGRLFNEGIMNGTLQSFDESQKILVRKRFKIPLCCNESIDPDAFAITPEGNALIRRLSIDYFSGTAELDLVYEDVQSVTLGAPDAIDDIYATSISTILNTSTAGKPSLLANDVGVTNVLAESKGTLLGGTVTIATDGHFIYVPPTGVAGADLFDYVGYDGTGKLDTANAKIIIKVGGVYVHMGFYKYSTPIYSDPPPEPDAYIIGYYWRYQVKIQYFEDPFLQVPLDVTAYGITVTYSYDVVTFPGSTFILDTGSGTVIASGFENIVFENGHPYLGTPPPTVGPDVNGTITPSPDYIIV